MLNESQVRAMLEDCEGRMNRRLTSIRDKLLHQRNPIEPIWELINIHAALRIGKVTEEVHGEPDIRLDLPGGQVVWIEATHVSPRHQSVLDDASTFPNWIRSELAHANIQPNNLHIQLNSRDSGYRSEMTVPPRNCRRQLKQSPSWNSFINSVVSTRTGTWEPGKEFNVVVEVSPGTGYTSGCPVVGIPYSPKDHVLYRAIKSKAKQVMKRGNRKEHQPLLLSICTSHPDTHVNSMDVSATKTRHAIAAAFANTKDWDLGTMHNPPNHGSHEAHYIPGTKYFSGLLITELREPFDNWSIAHHREANTRFFWNEDAVCRISKDTKDQLRPLQFNHFRYGPQWGERWQEPLDQHCNQDERRKYDMGSLTLGHGRNNVNMVEISTSLLLQILSGSATPQKCFESFSDDTLPDLQRAFSEGREINSIEIIPSVPPTRETQRVRITLSDPVPPVIAVRK